MVRWIPRKGELEVLEVETERGEESSRGFDCCVVLMRETLHP